MAPPARALGRLRGASISVAYRTETGVRDWLSRRAAARGWTPAIIPYSGYGSGSDVRVLARVVLAPPSVDPAARRDTRGWRRLLTLESPGTEVSIVFGGTTVTATSDEAGLIDTQLEATDSAAPGIAVARLTAGDRPAVEAPVHIVSDGPLRGVICDIDDTAWVTGISHPVRAARRTLRGTSSTRQSVPGMARLLREALDDDDSAVVYLSNGPWNLAGPVTRFLDKNDFPAGAILMTDWGITPDRWFRDGREHKSSALERLMDDMPHVTWVLVGDDGEHDPVLYADAAAAHPGRVAAIALRSVRPDTPTSTKPSADGEGAVPVLRGPDGDALLPLLREVLADAVG